jgi:hypothetical protein
VVKLAICSQVTSGMKRVAKAWTKALPYLPLFERATTSANPTYLAIILWKAVVPSILGF